MTIIRFAFLAPVNAGGFRSPKKRICQTIFFFEGCRMVFVSIFEHASSVFIFASSQHSLENAR